jgi:hypothetical protein
VMPPGGFQNGLIKSYLIFLLKATTNSLLI